MAQSFDIFNKTNLMTLLLSAMTAAITGWAAWYFVSADVYSLPANEIGDYLAGVFAPLALLWLIAAVFLQKSELAAQRQELANARFVALQHVEQARKNVAFIEEQTKILTDQRVLAKQDYADRQIDDFIYQIDSLFSRMAGSVIAELQTNNFRKFLKPIPKKDDESPAQYIMSAIARFDKSVGEFVAEATVAASDSSKNTTIKKHFTAKLAGIAFAMREIKQLCSDASPSKRALVSTLEFDRMLKAYEVYKSA